MTAAGCRLLQECTCLCVRTRSSSTDGVPVLPATAADTLPEVGISTASSAPHDKGLLGRAADKVKSVLPGASRKEEL
jgi:hypothetical protein